MADDTFKYDVAFSFLAEDESLARKLNEILKSRISAFFYADAERQREIAGRDGDAVYTRVFAEEARTVVVLYRPAWGERGFTLIEGTAIRNRAHEKGFDFVTFIPMHTPPTMPTWLPKPRVWIGLERWGIEHAASVIESRVQEAGRAPHDESAIARAERMQTERLIENERQAFLDSQDGANAALEGCQQIFEHLKTISERSHQQIFEPRRVNGRSFTFQVQAAHGHWTITAAWNPWVGNTTKKAELVIREWHGSPDVQDHSKSTSFVLDYRQRVVGWREKRSDSPFYRHADVADWIAHRLLSRIEGTSDNDFVVW